MKPVLNGTDYIQPTLGTYREKFREHIKRTYSPLFYELVFAWFSRVFWFTKKV